jgi:beta-phosphoglucomutase
VDQKLVSYGLLFDWDGVMIESSTQHEKSWRLLFAELGREMPADFFRKTFGMRNEQIIPQCFDFVSEDDTDQIRSLGMRKEELYREIIAKEGIFALPGVIDFLKAWKAQGGTAAVASSTPRLNIETILPLIGAEGLFDFIASAESVTRGKPAPDVFLVAAEGLQKNPQNCVVFEDAWVGIEAGLSAGCKVVGIATAHSCSDLLIKTHAAYKNLLGIDPKTLVYSLFESV